MGLGLLLCTACDIGEPPISELRGPDLHVLATFPEDGAGTDCRFDSPPDCGVPLDTPIQIRFDRFLLPKSAVRQSIRVYTGRAQIMPGCQGCLEPVYDVVERVVTFHLRGLLQPGLLYQVELVSPKTDKNGFGFQAFDGAPLSKDNDVPLRFSFFTAREAPSPAPEVEPTKCWQAWGALGQSGCSKGGCHIGSDAPMGLRLDSRASLLNTAIGRVAHEADTGPIAGRPLVDPPRFGTGMPVIDPGNPGTSYLLYKLLIGQDNFAARCRTKYSVANPAGPCPAPDEAEQERLRSWFVRLEPMPLGGALPDGKATMDLLQRYIWAGAETETCP